METQPRNLENWDDFISGDFLKAVNVNSERDAFVVTDVIIFEDSRDGSIKPRLTLEKDGHDFDFDLNKTNSVFLKNAGIATPKQLIGVKLYFKKALVRNPKTNLEVEGLRVCKVETK